MRIVFLLCAAVALAAAADEKPDEFSAPMTGEVEKVEEVEVVEAAPAVEAEGEAPADKSRVDGWSEFESRYFRFVYEELPWIDAERYCIREGGNLASIHSDEQYDFVQKLVAESNTNRFTKVWIGGSDAVKDGTWFWSDGSRFSFYRWAQGEPNNLGGNERCIHINHSDYHLWNDEDCELKFSFVCVRRRP